MKIAVVGHSLVVERNRGRWLALAERHPDVQVYLLVPAVWEESRYGEAVVYRVQPEQRDNYILRPVPTMMVGKHRLFRSLNLHLRQIEPDILQLATYSTSWLFMQMLWYRRLWAPRAKALWFTYENIYNPPRRAHQGWKQSFIYRVVDAAIAGGECVREVLEHTGFEKPIYVQTEIGVDPGDFGFRDKLALTKNHNLRGCVIGFVGVLSEEKGVLDLFDAIRQLSGDWSLLMVGDGVLRDDLQNRARDDVAIAGRVHFVGQVAHYAVAPYYNCMDVLVLPSHTTPTWREQFGLVLAEAMLSQVTVVGSDSGEIPYVISDAGLVFPEGDVQALCECLQLLIDNPETRSELAYRGYKRAMEKYSTPALADEVYSIYQKLLNDEPTK